MTGRIYMIRVEGHLDDHWSPRLAGLAITHDRAGTSTLTGPIVDQAQLHGVLTGLRDIGAVLIDLHTVDGQQAQRVGLARPGQRDRTSAVVLAECSRNGTTADRMNGTHRRPPQGHGCVGT